MNYSEAIEKYQKILVAYYDSISDSNRNIIALQECTGELDFLLELLCDELISEKDFMLMVKEKQIDIDFLGDYKLTVQESELSDELRHKLLMCCLNTYRYSIKPLKYSDALKLHGLLHIEITDDGFCKCDGKLAIFLNKLGHKLLLVNSGFAEEASADDVKEYAAIENDEGTEHYIVPTDYMTARAAAEIAGSRYCDDFIEYCSKNNIYADSRLKREYDAYVQTIKLSFTIRLYRAYRHICGENVNIIDFRLQTSFDTDFEMSADYADTADEILINDVLKKYLRHNPINNNDVIEIINDNRILHFVYYNSDDDFHFDKLDGFAVPMFDENKLWNIIRSFDGQIKSDGDKIYIPSDVLADLSDKERIGVQNILRQQQQTIKKQSNGAKQKLSEILEKARAGKAALDAEKAEKAAEKAEKRAARKTNAPVDTN